MRRIWDSDPLDVLIYFEAKTCTGCIHSDVVFDRRYCVKGKKFGQRCKDYDNPSERKNGTSSAN